MKATSDLTFSAATSANIDALGHALSHAFGFPRPEANVWFERARPENLRTIERGGRLCGGLIEIPMAQFFGGRSVTTMGVAGVGVVPEERGRGVGAYLMGATLREARERGFALSTLYPATVSLYRRAGYERAGARFSISFDPRTCEIPRVPEMAVQEVSGTPEEVVALYEATARRSDGYLDRGPYVWDRVSKPRGAETKTFTVSHGGTLEGYVVLSHQAPPVGSETTVVVTDLAATTARAARAILRLLVEYRSLAGRVRWHGGPSDLFTNLLPERHHEIAIADYFMVRVVDVVRALSLRGWPRGVSGELSLELDDASMPENGGTYALAVEEGQARVTLGEARGPRVRLTERGLAALYTGFARAHVLAAAGWLEADEDACGMLDAWFGGPLPTMRDMF